MLSREDNDILTLTGPGTAMGDYFRRYWIPFALARELPERDGAPVRVEILGEKLLAFRDSAGRVGLIEGKCPHRGADLYWGRNEECGLRCVFHGFKFDVEGNCVDMPIMVETDALRARAKILAYPTLERGGLLWAYMGPAERKPAPPDLEFMVVPDSHAYVSKKLQECNWAQAVEGALDTAHFSFLHNVITTDEAEAKALMRGAAIATQLVANDRIRWVRADRMPKFTILPHDVGMTIGASRQTDDSDLYWRIAQFVLPNHAMVPSSFPGEVYHGQCWVPISDTHCWIYTYTWHPDRPLTDAEIEGYKTGHSIHAEVDEKFVPLRHRANEYLIDRQEQKTKTYTGIKGVSEQDACIQDSQGFIADRQRELLGPTDIGVVRFRQVMLQGAKMLREGREPDAASKPAAYRVRGGGWVASGGKGLEEVMVERFGHVRGLIESPPGRQAAE